MIMHLGLSLPFAIIIDHHYFVLMCPLLYVDNMIIINSMHYLEALLQNTINPLPLDFAIITLNLE